MKSVRRNALSIHSWGGLGSQLLALGLLLDLAKTHPGRDFRLIIHSSGVTRRISEIDELSQLTQITFIDDFVPNTSKLEDQRNPKGVRLRSFLKWLLNFTRMVISRDSCEFRVMPWTRSIRCHYGLIGISKESIRIISSYLPTTSLVKGNSDEFIIGIHFRAGDLYLEKSSSLVNILVIQDLVTTTMSNHINKSLKLNFLSDSLINEDSRLNLDGFNYTWEFKGTWETFGSLLTPNSFIGTNSKISLWVALFRWSLEIPGEMFLPESLHKQFDRITRASTSDLSYNLCNPY